MKKFLLGLGISAVLVAAGCGQSDDNAAKTDDKTNADNTKTEEVQLSDKEIKASLIDTQVALTDQIRPFNVTVTSYVAQASKLGTIEDEAELQTAKDELAAKTEEANKAADDAVAALDSFQVQGELPEDMDYSAALADLKAYFTEAKAAIEANPESPDMTKADENFTSFGEKLSAMYEKVGLFAPDMSKELNN